MSRVCLFTAPKGGRCGLPAMNSAVIVQDRKQYTVLCCESCKELVRSGQSPHYKPLPEQQGRREPLE